MKIEPLGNIEMSPAPQIQRQSPHKPVMENKDVPVAAQMVHGDIPTVNVAVGEDEQETLREKEQQPGQQVSQEQMKKAAEKLNKNMQNSEAVFGMHEETKRVTIKIINKDTKEVIRELPPEKTLDMIAKAWELAGLLVDEKR